MIKQIFIAALMLSGCIPNEKATEDSTESGLVDSADSNVSGDTTTGIVSDNPPGADDWSNDSGDSADSGNSADSGVDTGGGDTALQSYENCSNIIDWRNEPDPLSKPCNFRLTDQNGNSVELYDYEGDVIMLDFSATWCYVCKIVAEHVQDMHDSLSPFTAITILTEDSSGNRPDASVLSDWASEYGITTSPILAATDELLGEDIDQWSINGMPCFFVIDKNFYLRKMQPGWNEATMTEYVESLILE
jgi:peroxiredoxin